MNLDFYKVLRVNADASEEEVKAAADRMLQLWYPEKFRRIAQKCFDDVCKAREVLLDAVKRHNFDKERQRHFEEISRAQSGCDPGDRDKGNNVLDAGEDRTDSHKNVSEKTGFEGETIQDDFDTNKPSLQAIQKKSSSEFDSGVSNNKVSERHTVFSDGEEDTLVSAENQETTKGDKTGFESDTSKDDVDTNKPSLQGIQKKSCSEADTGAINNEISERHTVFSGGEEDNLVSAENQETLKHSLSNSSINGRNGEKQSFGSLARTRDSKESVDGQKDENTSENVWSERFSLKSFLNHLTNISRMESDQLRELQDSYEFRLSLLKFFSCMLKFELLDKLTVIVNASGEVHLSDCAWCVDEAQEGPDTCHCSDAIKYPALYVEVEYGYIDEQKEKELLRSINENRKKRQNVPIVNLLKK